MKEKDIRDYLGLTVEEQKTEKGLKAKGMYLFSDGIILRDNETKI